MSGVPVGTHPSAHAPSLARDHRRRRLLRVSKLIAAGGLAACVAATPLSAQKVDTVNLRNGDRIVGEIKSLDQGALTYKTDDVGTLTIKWDKVYRIVSPRYFEVEDQSGRRYYGALNILNVVRIYPIGRGFWARVDGKLNLSLSFQRANRLRNFGVDLDAKYRTQLRLTELVTSTYFQTQEGAEQTSRNSIALSQLRFLQHRWLLTAAGQLEQNEELDLALRGLLGAGGGRFLYQTNRTEVRVISGLAYTNERFFGSSATSNLEMLFTGQANYFQRDYPRVSVQSTLTVYPSITDWGRVRTDASASATYEIIRDFNTGLTLFDKFDSRPSSTTAAKHDYGLSFTAGWLF
jgi:hypothetical protein